MEAALGGGLVLHNDKQKHVLAFLGEKVGYQTRFLCSLSNALLLLVEHDVYSSAMTKANTSGYHILLEYRVCFLDGT